MRRVIERHVQKIEAHADGSFDVYVGLSLPLVAGAGNNPCLQLFRYRVDTGGINYKRQHDDGRRQLSSA